MMQGKDAAAQNDFDRAFELDRTLRPQIQKVIDEIVRKRKRTSQP
jgi:hypothetical protein